MYPMIVEKAKDIISYGWWEDKILHSARYFGVPKEEYYEFAKVAKEFEIYFSISAKRVKLHGFDLF